MRSDKDVLFEMKPVHSLNVVWQNSTVFSLHFGYLQDLNVFFAIVSFHFISLFCTFVWWFHMIMCICLSVSFPIALSHYLFTCLSSWTKKKNKSFPVRDCFRSSSFQISLKSYYTPYYCCCCCFWNAIQFEKENRNRL